MVDLHGSLTYVFADDATDGALHFPFEILYESGHLCGDSNNCRQSESSGPARGLCGVCTAGEEQVCLPCLPFIMCLALQLSTSLEICCRALRIAAVSIQSSFHATACKLDFQGTKTLSGLVSCMFTSISAGMASSCWQCQEDQAALEQLQTVCCKR